MSVKFQPLKTKDLPVVTDIYNYYIENTTVTFHSKKLSEEEYAEEIPINNSKYPSYTIIQKDKIVGFCFLSQYKSRCAYNRTAEVTIYLSHEITGKGIGYLALQKLEENAYKLGLKVLIGVIAADNTESCKLFERHGYEKCAHFKQVGEKFGRILDVFAYQKIL